ncbi:MAG: class I SAM-dependent RNA methyltransferase [Gemmobacter sp.]
MRLVVERLGHRGDGVARDPVLGATFYVPGALPGEEVEGQPEGDRLTRVRILSPSPDRVRPPCVHARSCGGCTLQHASDAFVADWKAEVVTRALAAQGIAAEVLRTVTSPPRSRRRAVLAGRRGKGGAILGFHRRGTHEVIDTPDCLVVHPVITAAFPALREAVMAGAARGRELSLSVTVTEGGPDVGVAGAKPPDPVQLGALAERHGLARLTWADEVLAQRAPAVAVIGRARVPLPPGAFLQATAEGEAALVAAVRDAVGGARRVVDLFAGCGTFALPLAERAEIHAAEADRTMLAALDAGWRGAPGLRRITTETRDLFRNPLSGEELRGFDAAVIDPPRAGAETQVRALAEARLPLVAMVSCNPATFARDAKILTDAGYLLDPVHVIDQFRWSPHVELAARLRLPHIAA